MSLRGRTSLSGKKKASPLPRNGAVSEADLPISSIWKKWRLFIGVTSPGKSAKRRWHVGWVYPVQRSTVYSPDSLLKTLVKQNRCAPSQDIITTIHSWEGAPIFERRTPIFLTTDLAQLIEAFLYKAENNWILDLYFTK